MVIARGVVMRKCIVQRIWNIGTPYIQLCGFIILLGTSAYTAKAAITTIDEIDGRVKALEGKAAQIDSMDQKLDLAIKLLQNRSR